MPKSYLWGLNKDGEVFLLSSWDNCWQKVESSSCEIIHLKSIASSVWSIWCIGIDRQVYLYVPSSEIKIRTSDTIIENQRRDFSRYSGRNLKAQDPSEFASLNYYGKLMKSDLKSFALPSTRWKWENSWKVIKSFNGEVTEEGWIYSSSFMQKFQNHPNRLSNAVRRRYWQRYRHFQALEMWLLIEQDCAPFEITCNQENEIDLEVGIESVDYVNCGIVFICCGGEMLPHQKDGFISVWTINENGQVLHRLDVHRQNPEGSHWCLVKLPKAQKATCLSVGPLGHLLVYCSRGIIYFRENITWKNPIGSSWISLKPPEDLIDEETIVQLSMSVHGIWVRSSNNRVWSRKGVNLHEDNSGNAIGTVWILATYNISWISSSPSGQLWGLPVDGKGLLYRFSSSKLNKADRFWSGYMEFGFVYGEEDSTKRIINICAHSFFVEDDIMPSAWIQSPTGSRTMHIRNPENEDWRTKIMDSLITRDYDEYKNAEFSSYISLSEQVSWSKASDCQAQSSMSKCPSCRWLPANIVMHHKLKDNKTIASIHVDLARIGRSNPDMASFIESHEIVCVSKYSPGSKGNLVEKCSTLVIFIRKKEYRSSENNDQQICPRLLLKFPSENVVEDWILAMNFVMRSDIRNHIVRGDAGYIWILNQLYEPFYANSNEGNINSTRFFQTGGHFKMIESCAKGRIIWALGFNGIAWVNTNGWGGSYLGSICSSKDNLNTTFDTKPVSVMEYEKLKLMPRLAFGKFSPYMWTDEYDNIIRNKECVELASKRWQWCGNWSIDQSFNGGQCDQEGWQYSTSLTHEFDSHLTWNKSFRRRKWIRNYKTSMTGPWKEVLNNLMKIVDISLSTEFSNGVSDSYKCVGWAITDNGLLLRRRGISVNCPEGLGWTQISTNLQIVSISVNKECDLWVVGKDGSVHLLKHGVNRSATYMSDLDWEVVKHPNIDGKFIRVSSGDRYSLWAIDSNYHLWTRLFSNLNNPSVGDFWIHVCDQVVHVSCASKQRVFVLFATGSVAERVGISVKLPQGSDWHHLLSGIATFVSIRGA